MTIKMTKQDLQRMRVGDVIFGLSTTREDGITGRVVLLKTRQTHDEAEFQYYFEAESMTFTALYGEQVKTS